MEATSTTTINKADKPSTTRGRKQGNGKTGENAAIAKTTAAPTATTAGSEQKTNDTPPQDEDNKPTGRFVYIGPALPNGALPCNKIFQGSREEVEETLADILAKYPAVRHLIVASEKLAASKAKIRAANNLLGNYYAELKSAFVKEV